MSINALFGLTPFSSVHSINHNQPPISHDAPPIKKSNLITKAPCKLKKDINLITYINHCLEIHNLVSHPVFTQSIPINLQFNTM